MHVGYFRGVFAKRPGEVFFFDVCMESIEHGLEVGMSNATDVCSGGCGGVQKVTFKTVSEFNCKTYALTLRLICHFSVDICGTFGFFFGRPGARKYTQALMNLPALYLRPK